MDTGMTKILVFDSGSGSLPIADSIRGYLPTSELFLLADTEYFPYGEKSDEDLINRMQHILGEAVARLKPDILVLACNTASTIALDVLRQQFSIPIIGVVPAIKPAAKATKSGVIGLIATPATIKRQYTDDLITQFAADCKVILHGSTELVLMSEHYVETGTFDEAELKAILKPFLDASAKERLDQIILGCTHFALLLDQIDALTPGVAVVDSSDAIGRQVFRIAKPVSEAVVNKKPDYKYDYFHTDDGHIVKS